MTETAELPLLLRLGLRDQAARIYLALLKTGPASIRQVAASTGINRGTTYESIKQLVGVGLVSFHRRGERRKYFAEDPQKISELIAEKKQELVRMETDAQKLLPSLQALKQQTQGQPIVRFYEDDEGIAAILRDVLNTVGALEVREYFAYSSKALRQYIYKRFPNFTRRRIKEGIAVKVIAVGEGGEPVEMAQRKWLTDLEHEQFTSYTIIYGDKTALLSVSADGTPYGVIIEEPGVAAMQKYLFSKLWQSLPPKLK